MECFEIIVNGFQLLTTTTKHSILDLAALDPPLGILFRLYGMFSFYIEVIFYRIVIIRVSTDLLPSASAVTATYTFKNSHLILILFIFVLYSLHAMLIIWIWLELFTEFSTGEFLELYLILFYFILFL